MVLSLLSTLFATLTVVITHASDFLHRRSETSIVMTGADDDYLYVQVSNTGRERSLLRDCRLTFGGLPIRGGECSVMNNDEREGKNAIPPGEHVRIGLKVGGLRPGFRTVGQPEQYTPEEIRDLMNRTPAPLVTLIIQVQESNDPPGGPFHPRTDTFSVGRIQYLILKQLI